MDFARDSGGLVLWLTQAENARHWTFRSIYDDQRMLYG
jgi:hypothetical protein